MPRPGWLVDDWYSIRENWRLSGPALLEAQDDATVLALQDQDHAGIDIVCDGEQRRSTHHTYFLSHLDGVDFATLRAKGMRGRSTNLTDVPRVVGPVSVRGHRTAADFQFLRRLTGKPIKATLPGPSTLVDGSYDEYYGDERALAFAFADALNEEIKALAAAGCEIVQLDEPAVSRLPEKLHAWGVEAMDRAFDGTAVTSCVHVCYGYTSRQGGGKEWKHGYDEILPALATSRIEQFSLEFAEPGLPAAVLKLLPGKTVQLGVIDVGSTEIETAAQVASRLRAALEILPVEKIVAAPDCGCVALPRDAARAKLAAMVAGAGMVRRELGG